MRYTINIESAHRTNIFRLTKNGLWKRCRDVTKIDTEDYVSSNRVDIQGLLKENISIEVDGQEYEIHPEDGTELGNEKELHYELYGFRYQYPAPPSENQLLNVLINGDDSTRNTLVLKTDGWFYLLLDGDFTNVPSNPQYVVQLEGFQPYNGYVGNAIQNTKLRNYVQNLFRIGVFHWVNHLKFKILHDFADIEIHDSDQIPTILNLFEELRGIQLSWKPDYELQSMM